MKPRLGPPLRLGMLVVSTPAAADDPQPQPHQKTVWEKMQAGKDLIDSVPIAAAYDGIWSIIAHWSSPDPAEVTGSDEVKYRAFKDVAFQINRRLQLFTSLPLEKIDRLKLATLTREIGTTETELGAGR